MSIKVLMIGNHESVHGGITSVISQIRAHNWKESGIEMKFIPSYKGGGNIYKVLYFTLAYVRILYSFVFWKPDIVYIHMSHHGSFDRANAIYKQCKKNRIPVIVHLHGSEFQKYYEECSDLKKKKIETFLRECVAVITLGERWKSFVAAIAPQANIIVLNNTVHIPDAIAEQKEEEICFLYLGVLYKRKGVIDLLAAIKQTVDSGCMDGKKVVFNVGGTGPEESYLKSIAKDYGIERYVNFLGWVSGDEKEKQLTNNQVFVLPSYNEGLPIAILEAMSYGMPVIATDVGSISEAVKNHVNGYLFKPGDVEGYSSAISELINNYAKRCTMAREARRIAESTFNEDTYFREITEIYKRSL